MSPERQSPSEINPVDEAYIKAIETIEETCRIHGLNHRFVGGTLTDLLNPNTQAEIDIENRVVYLTDYNQPKMLRSDGTVKDADLISFLVNQDGFNDGKLALKEKEREAKKEKQPFPHVSIEPIRSPMWPRNRVLQMVSGFETDGQGRLYLTFDHLVQEIDRRTIEPWTIELADNFLSFTTLNPFAHALRYRMRVPSGVKRKDKEVKIENGQVTSKMILLMTLGIQVLEEGKKHGIDYRELYDSWIDFIFAMRKDNTLSVAAKRAITQSYWDTVGTAFAHGRGILKPLAELGDRFSG